MSIDTQEDLALFITMDFFFDEINISEFKDVYGDLQSIKALDYNPYEFKIWDQLENWSLPDLLNQIESQYKNTLAILNVYK